MKIVYSIVVCAFFSIAMQAQMNPVKWRISAEKVDMEQYKVVLHAHMDGAWVLYSQNTPDGGPIPTEITFNDNEDVEWVGEVIEPEPIKEQDPFFEIEVWKFKKDVSFQQYFTKKDEQTVIHGHIRFMTCDGMRCLPPKTQDFTLYVD